MPTHLRPLLRGSVTLLAPVGVAGTLLALSCASDEPTAPPSDTVPPAAVSDLHVKEVSHRGLVLEWTATGDDGYVGQATRYMIGRRDPGESGEGWDGYVFLNDVPRPDTAGAVQEYVVRGTPAGQSFLYAINVVDDNFNGSGPSNTVTAEIPSLFDPPEQLAAGLFSLLKTLDLEPDGDLDLLAVKSGYDGGVVFLINDGTGHFTSNPLPPESVLPTTVDAQDLTGDGIADLVRGYYITISISKGLSGGGFGAPVSFPVSDRSVGWIHSTPLGDIDGDGDVDLVVGTYGGQYICFGPNIGSTCTGGLMVLRNDSHGSFLEQEYLRDLCSGVVCLDMDGDAVAEIVMTSNTNLITLKHVPGVGFLQHGRIVPLSGTPTRIQLMKIDEDETLDLAVVSGSGVTTFLNRGSFVPWVTFPTRGPLAFLDVDGDGQRDLLTVAPSKGLSLFLYDWDFQYSEPIWYFSDLGIRSLVADDFDGDGVDEVVFAAADDDALYIMRPVTR